MYYTFYSYIFFLLKYILVQNQLYFLGEYLTILIVFYYKTLL